MHQHALSRPRLAIIIGSIRPNRFAEHAARWIEEIAKRHSDFGVTLIDLKDYPMPLIAEETPPLYALPRDEVARRWQQKMAEFDAYICTTTRRSSVHFDRT
jgi:NAD(P)H-dependent FMN reductase